jgi:hypothetical protein
VNENRPYFEFAEAGKGPDRIQAYNRGRVNQIPASNLRARLRRLFMALLLTIVGVVAVVFVLDYAIFRVRVAGNWNPYGSVIVDHYDAIPQKNGKTQFIFEPPGPQACVHALFPHAGSLPCWYLSRYPEQRTNY